MTLTPAQFTKLQQYIANVAITPSVFRNNAPKGTKEQAIRFLAALDLTPLKSTNQADYPKWLDDQTQQLMAKFAVQNLWGPARKALNIFMTMALLNRFLCAEYQLDRLAGPMEVPLDGRVNNELIRWAKNSGHGNPKPSRSFSIKGSSRGRAINCRPSRINGRPKRCCPEACSI